MEPNEYELMDFGKESKKHTCLINTNKTEMIVVKILKNLFWKKKDIEIKPLIYKIKLQDFKSSLVTINHIAFILFKY